MKERIEEVLSLTNREAFDTPLLPEKQHKVSAKVFPDGAASYYKQELFNLIRDISNKSYIANPWLNSGCPLYEISSFVNTYERYYNEYYVTKCRVSASDEIEFIKFVTEDSLRFFRDYYAWMWFSREIAASQPYKGIAKNLSKYIGETTDEVIAHIINYHSLPGGEVAIKWIGKAVDAVRFCDYFNIKVSKWNDCFSLKNGNPLEDSNRSKSETYRESDGKGIIPEILSKYPLPIK